MPTADARIDRLTYEVKDLSFHYPDRSRSRDGVIDWAVNRVSVVVREGEIFGVIGPNGSGKSSFLKALAKMVEPQAGTIRLFGQGLNGWSREDMARQVAYMPQDVRSDFAFSTQDMVLMGRFPYRPYPRWNVLGWEQTEDHIVVQHVMAEADVLHLADREVGTLSAGERQRVLLARALAQEPRVLLLDEPTAHLDLQHQLDLCRILKRVHIERGMTVILVSHDINLASQYCDRIVMMKRGSVMALGTPHQVITETNLEQVYGCRVLIDAHPESGKPRVCLPCERASMSQA